MPEKNEKVVALNVTLRPVDQSDQPISANYTTAGVVQGIAYLDLDFGFIEPAMLAMLARTVRDGKTIPESLEGKLVVRVAMGLDVLQCLQQQLQQVLIAFGGVKREEKCETEQGGAVNRVTKSQSSCRRGIDVVVDATIEALPTNIKGAGGSDFGYRAMASKIVGESK